MYPALPSAISNKNAGPHLNAQDFGNFPFRNLGIISSNIF